MALLRSGTRGRGIHVLAERGASWHFPTGPFGHREQTMAYPATANCLLAILLPLHFLPRSIPVSKFEP